MSNEELAVKIQSGETELMGQLWEQLEKMVKWKANHVLVILGDSKRIEFDDLFNSGFLALDQAVKGYNPDKGAFTTWFMLHLKTAFAEASGYRTKQGQHEPSRYAISFSAPVGDSEDSATLGDFLPDPSQAAMLAGIDENLWRQELRDALERTLSVLPEASRDIINRRYFQGQTLQEISDDLQISKTTADTRECNALRRIRQSEQAKELIPFFDFDYYSGVGLQSFRHSGASVQEIYLMRQEKQAERERRRKEQEALEKRRAEFDSFLASLLN